MAIKRVEVEGGWIDLKEKLRIGDKANIETYASDGITTDRESGRQTFKFNSNRYRIGNAAVRIVNMHVLNGEDKPIDYPTGKPFDDRVRVLSMLDEDIFDRLSTAIDAFEASMSAEKNASTTTNAPDSGPSSPSLDS